jgi:hypothetical protein
VCDTDFVRIWETAPTAADAARLCHVKPGTAGMRAKRLRDAGVPLRKFPTRSPRPEPLDVPGLRRVVEEARGRRGKDSR